MSSETPPPVPTRRHAHTPDLPPRTPAPDIPRARRQSADGDASPAESADGRGNPDGGGPRPDEQRSGQDAEPDPAPTG
ncbi:hypothetical protein AB0P15_33395 [Streptomyces sp. NPDC087917]|uniref:hypothetical protein n=1 Tax=unclassified Streptomyces TaxID=2593676 RepID=UPI0034267FA7